MRTTDPLSTPSRLQELLAEVAEELGVDRNEVVSLLRAASTFARRGSCSRYPEELLKAAIATVQGLLERESRGRISLRTFVENNLRILSCPEDIKEMLEAGEVTLFEALQLKRLSLFPDGVKRRRTLLEECRQKGWIAHRLRAEVDALLNPTQAPQNLPDFVSEQCNQLLSLLASTDYSSMTDQEREELLAAIDNVVLRLQRLGKQKPQVVLGL